MRSCLWILGHRFLNFGINYTPTEAEYNVSLLILLIFGIMDIAEIYKGWNK